jgi:hypothetical protein
VKKLQIWALHVYCQALGVYCRVLFFLGVPRDQIEAKLRRVGGPVNFLTRRIVGVRHEV